MKAVLQLVKILPVLLFFVSCKKVEVEKIIEVEKKTSWQLSDDFQYEKKIQTNSYVDSANLYMLSPYRFTTVRMNKVDTSKLEVTHYINSLNSDIQYKFPINSDIFVRANQYYINFYLTKQPVTEGLGRSISLWENKFDPKFYILDLLPNSRGECIKINKLNQCLIPYIDSLRNNKLLFVKLKVNNSFGGYFDGETVKTIIKLDKTYGFLTGLHSFNNNFYVVCSNKTLRITPDLNIQSISDVRLTNMFLYDGILYSFSENNYDLLKSVDDGKSWQIVGNNVDRNLVNLQFHKVNSKVLATYNSQIFQVEVKDNVFSIKELINDGLEGNYITSISEFNKTMYVTTLSGVFTKKSMDFLKYK